MSIQTKIINILRYVLAAIFLWSFLDKTFGFGFATLSQNAWINGMSPTSGFLSHLSGGPFASIFSTLAGSGLIDWLFMLGLLGVGVSLATKIFLKWGCYVGMTMMTLIYLSLFPPENNPFLDEHVVYVLVFLLILAEKKKSI